MKTNTIYNSCSGKKGSSCDSIDYILPFGQKTIDTKGSCGGKGCNLKNYKLPFGTSNKSFK